jgi:hypothetical protein
MSIDDLITTGYSGYGTLANFRGLFQVKDPDNQIIYSNAGYAADDFSSADTNGNTGAWGVTGIALPLDTNDDVKKGTYTWNYKTTFDNGTTVILTTATLDFQYETPEAVIGQTVSCVNRTFTSSDDTNYVINVGGVAVSPTTITYAHTVIIPYGAGFTPLPGTTTDLVRIIGGGNSAATTIWTNDWHTHIDTAVSYNLASKITTSGGMSASYVWQVVNDEVVGDRDETVRCDDFGCQLRQCYENLVTRWLRAERGHLAGAANLRITVQNASVLKNEIDWRIECGVDPTSVEDDLAELLSGENCLCTRDDNGVSVPVLFGGGTTITLGGSTFAFTAVTTPTGGNAGDVNLSSTGVFSQNVGGTWTTIFTISTLTGADGNDGADGSSASVLWNDVSDNSTSAGTSEETLKTYTLAADLMGNNGDLIKVKSFFELELNDNGKNLRQYWGGDLTIEYFTDSLPKTSDKYLVLESDITRVGTTSQFIESRATRDGITKLRKTTATKPLTNPVVIHNSGQNSVASAGDITCSQMEIIYYMLLAGTPIPTTGMKNGVATVLAGIPFTVTFASAFTGGTVYTLNTSCYDQYGNSQVVVITPGSQNVGGFIATAPTDGILNWSCISI